MKTKLLLGLTGLLMVLPLFADHKDGNPFKSLGYHVDVYTFGDGEEFHDGKEIVEIGLVLYDTQSNKVVGFVGEKDVRIELPKDIISTSIDPHCERYYSISPYAYCFNNPVNLIDPDGRDPKNPRHWVRFGGDVIKSVHAKVSIGLQASVKGSVGNIPIGGGINLVSVDLVGLKDGKIFTPINNMDKIEINQELEVRTGIVGMDFQKNIVTENGEQIHENKAAFSVAFIEYESNTKTPVDNSSGTYTKVGPSTEEKGFRVTDLSWKRQLGLGCEINIDINKIWEGAKRLLLEELI